MTPRGFFDRLNVAAAEQRQAQAVDVEPVDDQSTNADPTAEVAAFIDRPVPAGIEDARPVTGAGGNAGSYGGSARSTPLAEAAGFYSSGQS